MLSPGTPLTTAIELAAIGILYPKIPDVIPDDVSLDAASLQGWRDEAYRANNKYVAGSSWVRVVAWNINRADASTEDFSEWIDRTEVVLRLRHLIRRQFCTTELDVRHLVNEELSDEDRGVIMKDDPTACAGIFTTYRANPEMNRLIVRHGLLAYDQFSNRGIRMSHFFGMQYGQPDDKFITSGEQQIVAQNQTPAQRMTKSIRGMGADRLVERLDAGKVGNILAPTPKEVTAFEQELRRGASGKHTAVPPIRTR